MSLWLCLRFEQLPLQALTRRDNGLETATAILEKQVNLSKKYLGYTVLEYALYSDDDEIYQILKNEA